MRLPLTLGLLLAIGPVAVAAAETPASDATNEAKPQFDVLDFQIEGNSVLDDESLEKAVYPFMGPNKTVDDVEQARQALEEAYRNAGYPTVVVAIPEQDVQGGAVRLEVVEGTIETLHITGSRYYALGKIREGVPALAAGQVPHMPAVQAQMNTLAQQSSDRNVTPIFRAGSTPGKMEVELRVKDELPLHGSVEMNTRNSQNTTLTRLIGSLRYDNLWQKFHSASLQYQVSPENSDEVDVWSGTYVMPTGWSDTKLAFYGIGISSNTQSDLGNSGTVATSVGGMSVVGAGSIYGARLVKPLPSSDTFLHSASVGFDYKSFDNQYTLFGASQGSQISYASFMAGYDASWHSENFVTALNIAAHMSFRGLGNSETEFASQQRADDKGNKATPNFAYLTADIKHQQILPWDFRLHARAQGQASSAMLISNEQFSAGGPVSVRGYHQTEQLGDHGANLSLELYSPKLAPDDWDSVQNLRILAFADWAALWTANQAPTPEYYELASVGMGLRMQLLKRLSGEFDWGYPLYKQNSIDAGQQRVDFRLAYEF